MKLRLDLRLSQKLIMTPQLQQAIKLLQLSRLELQQSLTQHLMENPLLEDIATEAEESEATGAEEKAEDAAASADSEPSNVEESTPEERDTPDEISAAGWEEYFGSERRIGGSESQSSSQEEFPSYEQTMSKATSLEDHLLWQLSFSGLSDREKGIGRLIIDPDYETGEFAVIVHDDYQAKGLGYKLCDLRIGIAQEKGLERFFGFVLTNNKKMLNLCRKLGFTNENMPEGLSMVDLVLR